MNTISPEVKTALVTGTDHGVGFSLAKKLLARGYFVIAVRIDETEKQRFLRNLSIAFMNVDLYEEPEMIRMWEALFSSHDNYDFNVKFSLNKLIVVNNKNYNFDANTFRSLNSIKYLS